MNNSEELEENKVLVICSTLNQITNYLIIKKLKPKYIYNITYEDNVQSSLNIKNKKWDNYLRFFLNTNTNIKNIQDIKLESYNLVDIKNHLTDIIKNIENETIYWHITGGQRIITIAINDLIRKLDRKNDVIIYLEGNTEKAYTLGISNEIPYINYEDNNLTLKDALNLVGFDTKNYDSLKTFISKGKFLLDEKDVDERNFYKSLYDIFTENEYINLGGKKITFRNALLHSNEITYSKEYIKTLFEILMKSHPELKKYYQEDKSKNEFNYEKPAGYIFEKIAAHKIYTLLEAEKSTIIEMCTNLKIFFSKDQNENQKNGITDEIDIALLTNTGKIIVFECKSGGMSGDNAKSTKYTTYRLSGIFGMPILISPVLTGENENENISKNELKNQLSAVSAAERAELEVFYIDSIKSGLKRLNIIIEEED